MIMTLKKAKTTRVSTPTTTTSIAYDWRANTSGGTDTITWPAIDISSPTSTTTITGDALWTYTPGDNFTVDSYTSFNDQTPTDPIEIAEFKLQGICPACRKSTKEHDWSCPESSVFTINSAAITTSTIPSIVSIGAATLDEDKLLKLDKLLDLFDDDELDELIAAKKKKLYEIS
jgi:hypothetical protein